jgi:hypothetical protein
MHNSITAINFMEFGEYSLKKVEEHYLEDIL